jgi:hypothetical protein
MAGFGWRCAPTSEQNRARILNDTQRYEPYYDPCISVFIRIRVSFAVHAIFGEDCLLIFMRVIAHLQSKVEQ